VTGHGIGTTAPLELAIEASPNGIVVVQRDGTIVLVNRKLERQFGYERDELVGKSVEILVPEALRPSHRTHREDFAHAPEARAMGAGLELFGRRKDGSRIPVEIGLNPIPTTEGLLVLASIVDITERRRLEDEQRLAVDEQLAFERLVAELSGKFINHPADEMDEGIREALRRISNVFDVDRSTFHKIGPDGELRDSLSWRAHGVPPLTLGGPSTEGFPWTIEQLRAGNLVSFSTPSEAPNEIDRRNYQSCDTKSVLIVPLSVDGRISGAVEFDTVRVERTWSPEVMHRLKVIAGVFGQILARQQRDEAVRTALAEVERLKDKLQAENKSLQEAREWLGSTHVVGHSAAVRRVMEQIQQVSATDSTVLLLGETGTGKELFATQIHELGLRRSRPMVRVNCAAIPATLIESELFGREKGAYTGALARQVGRFELADHSTIFLDEIGDLPPEVQVKLLRVLEERQIERLGSPRPITVDTRIIAATHQNLEQRIAEGAFREDLFYRLNVFPIRVPPLRERVEDIPQMVWRFVEEFSEAFGKRVDSIAKESLTALQQYSWPGNVRELRNVVERAMIVATGPRLTIPVPHSSGAASRRSPKLVDVEKEHIRSVLESTGWRVRGPGGAADRLGLKPTTLETRMARLGLKRPSPQPRQTR
jgi:formate hydrogenlyase transcriptional activator